MPCCTTHCVCVKGICCYKSAHSALVWGHQGLSVWEKEQENVGITYSRLNSKLVGAKKPVSMLSLVSVLYLWVSVSWHWHFLILGTVMGCTDKTSFAQLEARPSKPLEMVSVSMYWILYVTQSQCKAAWIWVLFWYSFSSASKQSRHGVLGQL